MKTYTLNQKQVNFTIALLKNKLTEQNNWKHLNHLKNCYCCFYKIYVFQSENADRQCKKWSSPIIICLEQNFLNRLIFRKSMKNFSANQWRFFSISLSKRHSKEKNTTCFFLSPSNQANLQFVCAKKWYLGDHISTVSSPTAQVAFSPTIGL